MQLLLKQFLVFQNAGDIGSGTVDPHLVLVMKALARGLLDGDVAPVAIEDGQAERNAETLGIKSGSVPCAGQADVECGELRQN